MKTGVAAVGLLATLVVTSAPLTARQAVRPAPLASVSKIDEFISARLKARDIQPAALAPDAVFLRRAYLDTIGTLPTPVEVRAFLTDASADKRAKLIDQLLARDEFADYWAMKWCDLLRVKSEFPINLWPNAVQAYHHWIRAAIREKLPYDQFVRALLTESGSNFRVPPVNFYRAVQSREPAAIAQAVALTFMGARAELWPKDRLAGMAGFFSRIGYKSTGEWKEEIVFFDPDKGGVGAGAPTAVFPDGTTARIGPGIDPRQAFADWLITPANPWFTQSLANRAWYWLMGRGLIQEPDDIRPDNPPSHPELLAYLAQELAASHYDVKHLFRLILNSTTYQQSSAAADTPDDTSAFAHYLVRPLDAEVLIDALCQITGTSEQYSSAIPEPYTFLPENTRAIALADGSITSPFLVTFGRPPRDTGLESERSHTPTAAERLHLLNSSHIQRKVEQSTTLQALMARGDMRQAVTLLYVTILSRMPTDAELKVASDYGQSATNRRQAGLDLAWALINTTEFLYRH
jgi:hypothetical protein